MNILHVIRDLSRATGGPVNALKGLSEAQAALGHKVTILATDAGDDKVVPAGVHARIVPAQRNSWFWSPKIKPNLQELLPDTDIVHAHMVWDYPIWEAARQSRRFGRPFVLRPCGNLETWSMSQKRLKKMLYLRVFGSVVRSASAIHFTSEHERMNSATVTGHDANVVIPLGVLPDIAARLDPGAFSRRFGELAGRQIVLFLGRLHPKKQPELVLDAFAAVAGDDLRRHLVMAGPADEAYLAALRGRAEGFGIGDRVTFTGMLGDGDVREAFAAADVFVLPSQQENFGISVVEAMAVGCPVVISDHVGVAPDVVAAGAGIVCPMEPASIAQALRRLLPDAALRRQMGDSGRRLVSERYTWPRIAAKVLETYARILETRQPAAG